MKIGDDLMWRWIELLSLRSSAAEAVALREAVAKSELNPREVKLRLAHELVSRFYDDNAAAEKAIAGWQAVVTEQVTTTCCRYRRLMFLRMGCASLHC